MRNLAEVPGRGRPARTAAPRRIVFVVNTSWFFVSHRMPIALAAREAGFDVHVAAPEDSASDTIRDAGFTFHPVPFSRRGKNAVEEGRVVASLLSLYRRLKPDVVHHITIQPILYGSFAARITRVPAVVNAVSGLGYLFVDDSLRTRALRRVAIALYRFGFRHPNSRVIFQNPDDLEFFVSRGIAPADAAVLIRGSGVNMAQFVPGPEPDGEITAVFAARLLWHKGVGEFVEAARLLKEWGVPVRMRIAGESDGGNPAAVPEEVVREWHENGDVEWIGYREDMPSVLRASHIACLPSSYGEGVPKVLIEAAAAGRPLVTTDAPGCREIVREGENGFLVPIGDSEALARAIRDLAADGELRARFGRRSREIATAEFSVEHVVEETLGVYDSLLG